MARHKQGFTRNRAPNVHKQDRQCSVSPPTARERPRAPAPTSLPDEVWDVFCPDETDLRDEPEPGDFWWEPDDAAER